MNRVNSGGSIVQYVIIVSLIALFLVPTFINIGQAIKKNLDDYRIALKKTNSEMQNNFANKNKDLVVKDTIIAGELGGTLDKPKSQCVNGVCSVDFGEFVFNNIPKNFKEFVETSGFSGGTSMLAELLEEVAQETTAITTPEANNLLTQLAVQGHIFAGFEVEIEQAATSLIDNPDLNPSNTLVTPSKNLLEGNYRRNFEFTLAAINELYTPPLTPEEEALLNLINYLSGEILLLADTVGENGEDVKGENYDLDKLYAILSPQASTTTNLDSAIICNTAGSTDTGTSCQ